MNKQPVKDRIAELRSKSEKKTLLTYNDRLEILARDAQIKGDTPAHVRARATVVKVYSEISGDRAPDRLEVTGKDGAAIPVAVSGSIDVTRTPVRLRIAQLKAAADARRAEEAKTS